ncbi:MAG TPA: transposase [Candidatus Paceibacterota bacterium]|nr:transposase [Candidatus Paceibacterota bacterium]
MDDSDRELFMETLGETCEKTGWQVHAYCLMGNHLHLVVEHRWIRTRDFAPSHLKPRT